MVDAMDVSSTNGAIVPPAETKATIEATAKFVSKSKDSAMLEQKILSKQAAKCSFLRPSDPYHAYYLQVLKSHGVRRSSHPDHHQDGTAPGGKQDGTVSTSAAEPHAEGEDASARKPATEDEANGDRGPSTALNGEKASDAAPATTAATDVETTEKAASISRAKAAEAKAQALRQTPTEPPPADVYTLAVPAAVPSALSLEVIRLTAQFAAQGGRPFIAGVNVREYRNPLFAFLKPEHPHFPFFQSLTTMYQKTISPDDAMTRRLEKLALKPSEIHAEVMYRCDWDQLKEQESSKNDDEERIQMQLIDWHDFVLVETIELDEEDTSLQAPIAPNPDVATRNRDSAAAKAMTAAAAATAGKDTFAATREGADEEDGGGDDMDMDIDEPGDTAAVSVADPMADVPSNLVRTNYVPQVTAAATPSAALNVVLPSGQTVPVTQATASVKVELLDPKYKEERARAADKNRLQNLASDDEIARNLGRLVDSKTEVFGRVDLQQALHSRQVAAPPAAQSSLPHAPAPQAVPGPETKPAQHPPPPAAAVNSAAAPQHAMPYANAAAGSLPTQPPEKRPRVDDGSTPSTATASGGTAVTAAAAANGAPASSKNSLLSEDEWIAKHGDSVQVHVRAPTHSNTEWELQGQTIYLQVPLKATVGALKATLAQHTKLPSNKQKLQVDKLGFLKDSQTLASYNISRDATINLEVKERGGKRK